MTSSRSRWLLVPLLAAGSDGGSSRAAEVVPLDGTVLWSRTGDPVVNATVKLALRGHFAGEAALAWEAQSDGAGRFRFPALPARRTFAVTVRGPSLPIFQPLELIATGHSPRHLPALRVPAGVCHQGNVLDVAGKPLAGVAVRLLAARNLRPPDALTGQPRNANFIAVSEAVSGPDGGFSVWRSVLEPEAVLQCRLAGYTPALAVVRAGDEPLIVRLEKAHSFGARVVDTWGAPVAGVTVLARPRIASSADWIDLLACWALSGQDGSLVLDGLDPGESYNVTAEEAVQGFVLPAGEDGLAVEARIVVGPPSREGEEEAGDVHTASIAGRVVDAAAGKPIEGAQVELWPPGHGKHSEIGAATDAEGRFEVRRLLPDCESLLTVRAPGHRPIFDDLFIAGQRREKEYRLEPAPAPVISVRSAEGHALADVPVSRFVGDSDLSHLYARGLTDVLGRCVLDGATEAQVVDHVELFDANAGLSIPTRPDRRDDGALVVVAAPARVRGAVADSRGQPLAGARIRFWQGRAYADREGRFFFPALPPGERVLEATARGKLPREVKVRLQPGVDEVLDLVLEDDLTYQVKLVDDLGRPVAGMVSDGEVADGDGAIHVPAEASLSIWEPFHERSSDLSARTKKSAT